jgi:hypothetical protein
MNSKNYLSNMYVSRSLDDNLYIFLSINENLMLKDRAELYKLFTEQELLDIFSKVVTKKILLQGSDLRTYPIESVAEISQINILDNQQFTTYLIKLKNNLIEFPARILFNYSFKFRYYRFLDEKLKNINARTEIDIDRDLRVLYSEIANYDEALVNYDNSELIRHTETVSTGYIDFRNYDETKERVTFVSTERDSRSLLQQILFDSSGYTKFEKIIIDKQIQNIFDADKQKLAEYYGKLVNSISDYDYKRFLNQLSIFVKNDDDSKKVVDPELVRANTENANVSSEEGLFKKENTSLKTDEAKDSANLFLSFVLNDGIVKPVTEEENNDYKSFLIDSFDYPTYFFKHVLKFQIEYLVSIDPNSMHETWGQITQENVNSIINFNSIFCRLSLKNKKYFDKVAYEYFILEA